MEEEVVKEKLDKALNNLIQKDSYLLEKDVNERSITYKLANYLEACFPEWDVDCEYNRNHDDSKRLKIKPRKIDSNNTQGVTVFPDIVIHKRGVDKNLLVIEIKKTTSRESDDYDHRKLGAFKLQLKYKFAVFIKLKTNVSDVGLEEELEWF